MSGCASVYQNKPAYRSIVLNTISQVLRHSSCVFFYVPLLIFRFDGKPRFDPNLDIIEEAPRKAQSKPRKSCKRSATYFVGLVDQISGSHFLE